MRTLIVKEKVKIGKVILEKGDKIFIAPKREIIKEADLALAKEFPMPTSPSQAPRNPSLAVEIGGATINVNGHDYTGDPAFRKEFLTMLRKSFPREFGRISQEYNPNYADIVVDKGMIYFFDENGKLISPPVTMGDEFLIRR